MLHRRRRRFFAIVCIMLLLLLTVAVLPLAGITDCRAAAAYTVYGSQTMLESAKIDYFAYMEWLSAHDADSDSPDYYLGTPYIGGDYRTPNGEVYSSGNRPPSYAPYYGHGLNCTGFVRSVLTRAGEKSGAPKSALSALPAMRGNFTYWSNHSIYRLYFAGSSCIKNALNAGVLEKGDILWIRGTADEHTGIFYGDTPTDNRFWHSGPGLKKNAVTTIQACGSPLGMYVIKAVHPSRRPVAPTEEPTEAPTETPAVLRGDVNRDGVMDIDDVTQVQRCLAEFTREDGTPYADIPDWLLLADRDADGAVTITDVTDMQRALARF